MEAWDRLRDIFQDNQHSRAVALEQEFSTTSMENFPNASSYCQHLKSLADQLKNVGAPVSDSRIVLQLVGGLTRAYRGVGTLIRQRNPIPPFYKGRSMLVLEEIGMEKEAATESAMVAASSDDSSGHLTNTSQLKRKYSSSSNNKRSSGSRKNAGCGSSGGSGGARNNGNRNSPASRRGSGEVQATNMSPAFWQQVYPWGYGWPIPPCPYPTQGWTRPGTPNQQAVLLCPRPRNQQAYMVSGQQQQSGSMTPTDIQAAMHTMSDTGATSHMTSSSGFLDGEANNEV
ncbi:uncharacterized protein LOC114076087 [Solanum pennellii]|uniref:Uncharacterized protein LOC114076087 n=1 Tax=Solanum pennellii TaxID=28526 RepID=A0ABM1V3M1_SOLPN|nr:uncharacterized protein LOC114076087 [Solanum pennellii]